MAELWRVRAEWAGGSGGRQLSTFWFEKAGELSAQNAATAARTFLYNCRSLISSSYSVTIEPDVAEVSVETGEVTGLQPVTVSAVSATQSSDPLPWQTQGLVRMTTGDFFGGRQVIGHLFIPGPTEVHNTGGVPSSEYLTGLTDNAAALNGDTTCNWMVYSRKNRTAHNIASATPRAKWAVLRSRRD